MKWPSLLICAVLGACQTDDGSSKYTPPQFSCHMQIKAEVARLFGATFVRSDLIDLKGSDFAQGLINQYGKNSLAAEVFLETHGISNDRDFRAVKRLFDRLDTAQAQSLFAEQIIQSVSSIVSFNVSINRNGRAQNFAAACLTLSDGTTHLVVRE